MEYISPRYSAGGNFNRFGMRTEMDRLENPSLSWFLFLWCVVESSSTKSEVLISVVPPGPWDGFEPVSNVTDVKLEVAGLESENSYLGYLRNRPWALSTVEFLGSVLVGNGWLYPFHSIWPADGFQWVASRSPVSSFFFVSPTFRRFFLRDMSRVIEFSFCFITLMTTLFWEKKKKGNGPRREGNPLMINPESIIPNQDWGHICGGFFLTWKGQGLSWQNGNWLPKKKIIMDELRTI